MVEFAVHRHAPQVARLLSDAGITTILVTHDQSEALSFADQLAVMRQGRLVQSGHPMDLYQYPVDEQTALFLGEAVVMPARVEAGWAHCDLGRVAVDSKLDHEATRIMLRPEQLQLSTSDLTGCPGVVTEREFGGNICTLTVKLHANGHAILVRSSGLQAPPMGSVVHLTTLGLAHILKKSRTLSPS